MLGDSYVFGYVVVGADTHRTAEKWPHTRKDMGPVGRRIARRGCGLLGRSAFLAHFVNRVFMGPTSFGVNEYRLPDPTTV